MPNLTAHTSRIKPIAMATAAPCWQPVLLAKMVTTLDVLSGGRALLGIGAGDYEEEARGSGLPFPPLNERYERLEEMLQICLRMWHGEQADERPFEGKHYRIERPLNLPQSLSRPHPPILLAGSGEHKTLRLVARYADACNLQPGPQIPKKLEVLRQHCEAEGRDYDAIEKTCMFAFDLWDYHDVSTHAQAILGRLSSGTMPCDGKWPEEQIALFRRWVEAGMPA